MQIEEINCFLEEFGEPDHAEQVAPEVLEAYSGVMPPMLLKFWEEFGQTSFAQGLIWFVNPKDYEFVLDLWLAETPLDEVDTFYVFARSAFGELYVWGEKSHRTLEISCPMNHIFADEIKQYEDSPKPQDQAMGSFFLASDPEHFDLMDEQEALLFHQALEKLGPLQANEVYGFVPALCMGGRHHVDNLQKLEIMPHLAILQQMGERPNVLAMPDDVGSFDLGDLE